MPSKPSSKAHSQQQSPSPSQPQKSSQQKPQPSKQKSLISSKKKPFQQQKSIGSNNSGRSSQSSSSIKQQEVMQQAIEKASCLIELLTRENSEFRQMIGDLETQLQEQKENCVNLKVQYDNLLVSTVSELKNQIQFLTQQNTTLIKQNQSLLIQAQKNRLLVKQHLQTKQSLAQLKQKTKQLHLKIAHLTKSTTQLNQFKIQYLSLQNENQYLLRELERHTQKQNVYSANITQKETEFSTKLSTLDKAKDAFARRTHELQQQNLTLIMQIEQLRKDKIDLQIITQQTMHTLDLLTNKIQTYKLVEQKINQIYQKVQLQERVVMNEKYARSPSMAVVGCYLKEDLSTNQKMYHIQQVLNYRLQQMQAILQQIVEKLMGEKNYIGSLNHLRETQLTVQRLNDYLNEMSTSHAII